MRGFKFFKQILKFSSGVLLLELLVLAIIYFLCRQTGWVRIQQIGIVVASAGGFLILFSLLGFQGDWGISNKYSDKIGSVRPKTPFLNNFFDLTQGEGYFHGMFALGVLNIIAGFAVIY